LRPAVVCSRYLANENAPGPVVTALRGVGHDVLWVKESMTGTVAGYDWIVVDPDLLGGQPAIRGTRLSVAHVLACLAEGMSAEEITTDYPGFPPDSVPEVLRFAAQHLEGHREVDVAS